MSRPLWWVAALSSALFATEAGAKTPAIACHESTRYDVIELPFLPSVISPTGVVAGTTERHRAVVWEKGSGARELAVPDGFRYTEPVGITPEGDVVVNALDAEAGKRQAFLYSRQAVTALAGHQTIAHGASRAGVIVGEWVSVGSTSSDAVYWTNNTPHPIGLSHGGAAKGVNRAGEVIGDAYDAERRYHAFVWSPAKGQRMVGPADRFSAALAINDAGHVLFQVGSDAYLDKAGAIQHLTLSPNLYNSTRAMNDCDFVVGGFGTDSEHYRAFLWTPAKGFQDLNALTPKGSGWKLESATAINDRGDIVGIGDFRKDDRGYLLVPRL